MRKIAILSLAVFAAACGSSSDPAPANGYLRVGNLASDVAAIDFCVKATGTTSYGTAVMSGAGATSGLVYGGTGLNAISRYFTYAAGSYDIAVFDKGLTGSSCTNPLASLTGVSLAGGAYKLVALVGVTGGTTATNHKLVALTDEVSPTPTTALVRVVNAGQLNMGAGIDVLPAFDLGITASGTYTKIFGNVAYPGVATVGTVDANGYASVTASTIPATGLSLTVCAPAGTTLQCQSTPVRDGSITGNIGASVFVMGLTDLTVVPPVQSSALFCGDVVGGQVIALGNYSACTTNPSGT